MIQDPNQDPSVFIYFVRSASTGLIKIGMTTDIESRLANLRAHEGTRIDRLLLFAGEPWMETRLHHRFRRHLARGREWFHPDPELLDFIRSCRRRTFVRLDQMERMMFQGHYATV